jgi:hypothetical protein
MGRRDRRPLVSTRFFPRPSVSLVINRADVLFSSLTNRDNRIVNHSALFDFYPAQRHGTVRTIFSSSFGFRKIFSALTSLLLPFPLLLPSRSLFFCFFPLLQRVTPQAEPPTSVADYEKATGSKAKDWAVERAKELGVSIDRPSDNGKTTERGYKD